VTPAWLRGRADDSEDAATAAKETVGPSQDAFKDLAWSADGWEFVKSIDEMQSRWEDLNQLIRDRLAEAARNFRLSADAYTETETAYATGFQRMAE
jgi:hypothetical protein